MDWFRVIIPALGFLVGRLFFKLLEYYELGEYKNEEISLEDLTPGDHIYVRGNISGNFKRKTNRGAYFHHGVYLGELNGKKSITDFGREKHKPPVIATLEEFLGKQTNCKLWRRRYTFGPGKSTTLQKIIERATNVCKNGLEYPVYDLRMNNCEHYATFLKKDDKESIQVLTAIMPLPLGACISMIGLIITNSISSNEDPLFTGLVIILMFSAILIFFTIGVQLLEKLDAKRPAKLKGWKQQWIHFVEHCRRSRIDRPAGKDL